MKAVKDTLKFLVMFGTFMFVMATIAGTVDRFTDYLWSLLGSALMGGTGV